MIPIRNLLVLLLAFACAPAQAEGVPGQFDYYVLSLSWSPQHCAEVRQDKFQCAGPKQYGFIVHGLWPQYETGYPDSCSTAALPEPVVRKTLTVMPSEKLIRHEWKKHGTCSGIGAEGYFALVRDTFGGIRIPAAYATPDRPIRTTPKDIGKAFAEANPGLEPVLTCKGKYLSEIRLCYDKNMRPRSCGADVRRSRCPADVVMRPVKPAGNWPGG